jgi:aspartate aminotransferase
MKWPAARMKGQAGKGYGMYETAARLQQSGVDIIHLEVGRPSSVTPAHVREASKKALDDGIVHYGELQGLSPLREALAARYRREQGIAYTADEILITNGVTQASYAAFMSALDEGDEVIVLDPFYPQHNSKIRLTGARVVLVPMVVREGMFRLDAELIKKAITSSTRMIVLINPSNPVGTVCTRDELEQLAAIAREHDLLVLSDEVYEYITFGGCEHISIASLPGMKERTITVNAFTKAYAMDGWRIGYAAAPSHMISTMRQITMNTTTHPCVFAQEGALVAVTGSQDCVREMVDDDRRRRDLVVDTLNAIPGITCSLPQGTIYAFPDIRGLGIDSDALAEKILHSAHVAVESGSFYGRNGEGHLRVCFGSEPYERVAEGMERLKTCLS